MAFSRLYRSLDHALLTAVSLILAIGLVVIGSASTDYEWWMKLGMDIHRLQEASLFERLLWMKKEYVIRQLAGIILGLMIMVLVIYVPYDDLRKHTQSLYWLNLMLLGVVLFAGSEAGGAQRWIDFGPLRLQPSEIAKIIIVITFAAFLAEREGKLNRFRDLIPCFIYISIPMLLILMQPDLGTSLVFIAIMFGMLFASGARPLLVGGLLVGGVTAAVGMVWAHLRFDTWIPLKEYQLTRLTIFLDPWADWQGAGYQMIQSKIAIGSGGLWGKGLMGGTQSFFDFLPIRHTDFIFSVIGEEFGYLGALLVLGLLFFVIYRGLCIATEAKDRFGMLIATGICSMLTFQVLVNVGMTVGIMPVTGLPLPFLSYGGSSMLANMVAIGLLLNVYARRQKIMF